MVGIYSQEKFADDIVNYIISRVTGTHSEDEIISERPSKSFLIGTLAARKERDVEEEVRFDEEGKAASIRASRLRVTIRAKKSELDVNPEITVKATGNVYYQIKKDNKSNPTSHNPEESDLEKKKHQWKRLYFSHDCKLNISLNSECYVDFFQVRETANNDPLNSKQISDDVWRAKIYTKVTNFNDEDVLISFNYENAASDPDQIDGFERTLFNCRLEADIGNLLAKEFCDDYLYENHKQRYYYDFRTINCQAKWVESRKRFVTEHFGRFEQENIRPKEGIPNLNLTFSNLMSSEGAVSSLDGFVNEMKRFLETYKNNIPVNISENDFQPRVNDRENTWGERIELKKHFESLINRVERGLNLIKSNPDVKEAFLKTNETFKNYYQNQDVSSPDAGWRLFQIAFFLSSIESVVEKKNLDVVDVLHVDTGGGKSEAYFALVIFTSFYERITGKKDGVSAIVIVKSLNNRKLVF